MTAVPDRKTTIDELRRQLGDRVSLVGHHYQSHDVIRHADLRGDSLELARRVRDEITAEHIVFCGVYFMAESAALLAAPHQTVHLPEPSAECSMALMSPAPLARVVLERLQKAGRKVVPLAYVNSTLGVKAVVGEFGGSVCTSANAKTMMEWALDQGESVLFLPDRNLGSNVADLTGVPVEQRHRLDIRGGGERMDMEASLGARLLLWPGHCAIHSRFKVFHVDQARRQYPDAKVIVHPECTPDVVAAADAAGSTSAIIRYVEDAPAGTTIVVGTEHNLVDRLARQQAGRVNVVPLARSLCIHMAQTTEERVQHTLEAIIKGNTDFVVSLPDHLKEPARRALEIMLSVCA